MACPSRVPIVVTPLPAPSAAQAHWLEPLYFSISPLAQSIRDRPLPSTSRPLLAWMARVISSALTVIPLPAPMFRVRAPVVPPPVNPEPAVTAVVAWLDTLPVVTTVPPSFKVNVWSPERSATSRMA